MVDYLIAAVAETQIMDVFEHNKIAGQGKTEVDDKPEYEQAGGEEAK